MMTSRTVHVVLLVVLSSGLAGCSDGSLQEVKQWMEDIRRQAKVVVPKLPEPKKFTPFAYEAKNSIDPYNPSKLAVALAKLQSSSTSSLKPNLDRRREPLESYPLDTVKMVGTLQKTGLSYVLLQVDKTVFQAKIGNYVGQNFGLITNISDTEIELKETVQDASGDWVERKTKLELQEIKK